MPKLPACSVCLTGTFKRNIKMDSNILHSMETLKQECSSIVLAVRQREHLHWKSTLLVQKDFNRKPIWGWMNPSNQRRQIWIYGAPASRANTSEKSAWKNWRCKSWAICGRILAKWWKILSPHSLHNSNLLLALKLKKTIPFQRGTWIKIKTTQRRQTRQTRMTLSRKWPAFKNWAKASAGGCCSSWNSWCMLLLHFTGLWSKGPWMSMSTSSPEVSSIVVGSRFGSLEQARRGSKEVGQIAACRHSFQLHCCTVVCNCRNHGNRLTTCYWHLQYDGLAFSLRSPFGRRR